MRRLSFGDTKPRNYEYLTFKIIFSSSNEGKVKLLECLEQMLLKSIINYTPRESKPDMEFVQIFEGKNQAKVISTWLMEFNKNKKLASILMKLTSVRYN